MTYLHWDFELGADEKVEVELDHPANVCLLDDENFQHYERREHYKYHGGYAKTSPIRLTPPKPGHWHVVVDLGGYGGQVRAAAFVTPATVHA